jgi:intein-encoded DNA endonuclease-like protein
MKAFTKKNLLAGKWFKLNETSNMSYAIVPNKGTKVNEHYIVEWYGKIDDTTTDERMIRSYKLNRHEANVSSIGKNLRGYNYVMNKKVVINIPLSTLVEVRMPQEMIIEMSEQDASLKL